MPFEITNMDGIALVRLSGRIGSTDIVQAAQTMAAHPEFEPGQPRIWDARGITQVLLNIGQAWELCALVEKYIQHLGHGTERTGIIVEREIDREVAEFIHWYLRGRSIRVFKSIHEAQAWVLES